MVIFSCIIVIIAKIMFCIFAIFYPLLAIAILLYHYNDTTLSVIFFIFAFIKGISLYKENKLKQKDND